MSPSNDDQLSEFRRVHVGRALARAYWAFTDRFATDIRRRGFPDFRPSDVEVIARLPTGHGARVSELAERSRTTKQAIGKLVRGLQERGYVTRRPDPQDGRAQRVDLTERGRRLLHEAREVIAAIELEWATAVSPDGLEALRSTALQIADEFGPPEYL